MSNLYSEDFKAKIVAKLLHPDGPSVLQLSDELGISKSALYKWIKKVKNQEVCNMASSKNTVVNISNVTTSKVWTDEQKFMAVCHSLSLSEQDLCKYCREQGIYLQELNSWKTQMLSGFNRTNKNSKELRESKNKTKKLEKELLKKEKALAEVSALLVLKKKVTSLLEE